MGCYPNQGFSPERKEHPSRDRAQGELMLLMRTISRQKPARTEVRMSRALGITGRTAALGGLVLLALSHNPVQGGQNTILAWDQSPDPNVAGYRLYHGGATRTYTNSANVGRATSLSVSGLVAGTTHYFAVTAYTLLGLESDFSDEASFTVPRTLAELGIRAGVARQVVVSVSGPIARTYEILASETLTAWTVVGRVTVGASGSVELTLTNAGNVWRRFYRTREIQ